MVMCIDSFASLPEGGKRLNIFFKPQESFAIANEIMSSEGLFRNCSDRSDPRIIRNVLHDTSPSYFQYVDELWSNRNGNEENLNLEKLDSFEASKKEKCASI